MDFFDSGYFKINKILLSVVGLWPFRATQTNRAIVFLIVTIAGTQFAAKVFGLISVLDDMNLVFESIVPMIVDVTSSIKLIFTVINTDRIKAVLLMVEKNCRNNFLGYEAEIVNEYCRKGKKFTVMYSGFLYFGMTVYIIIPTLPLLMPQKGNATERHLVHNVEYFVDQEKYFYPMLLHGYIAVAIFITIIVAVDSIFVVIIQHACSLFTVLGYRLDNATKESALEFDLYPIISEDHHYKTGVHCVRLHNDAIEFAELIGSSFSTSYFWQTGLNMLLISFTSIQAAQNLHNFHELVRQLFLQLCIFLHLYLECSQGQQLMDHSSDIYEMLISVRWYNTSIRTRKLINIMTMRAKVVSVLTAGKMFTICMESFGMILRTAMSYFTVLQSMQ